MSKIVCGMHYTNIDIVQYMSCNKITQTNIICISTVILCQQLAMTNIRISTYACLLTLQMLIILSICPLNCNYTTLWNTQVLFMPFTTVWRQRCHWFNIHLTQLWNMWQAMSEQLFEMISLCTNPGIKSVFLPVVSCFVCWKPDHVLINLCRSSYHVLPGLF